MKISRLMGIVTVLWQRGQTTAPALAALFEVSHRTIHRDIDVLCRAGIPIVTRQGQGGGISLMQGFNLNTTLFTKEEMQAVLAGIKSVSSVTAGGRAAYLEQKLGAVSVSPYMRIDLSSFYKESLSHKIALLQQALSEKQAISFRYYYAKGEADKLVEPCYIVFKWSDWYVFGWCRTRQDFRLYKLRRLWDLRLTGESFTPREIPPGKEELGTNMADDYFVSALFHPSLKYRLVEDYGPGSFAVQPDGRLLTYRGFTSPEDAARYFLAFGTGAEVTAPPEMREKIRQTAQDIAKAHE